MSPSTMLLSDRFTGAMRRLTVLLLCAAAISGGAGAAARVDTFSYPAFDATTTRGLIAASNASILLPASLLFEHDGAFAEFNRTEGFLLLPGTVDVWRPGPGGAPVAEASFNTSFTLTAAAAPVAFVLLNHMLPPLRGRGGLRGFANYTSSDDDGVSSAAAAGLAAVEVGRVRSYGPDDPSVGLNVTVTPNDTSASRTTVWIEYDAAGHRLHVRVASAGDPRPAKALIDAPLYLAEQRTTETASVGFFAAAIRDIVVGVRGWDLAVDSLELDGGGKKGTAWWVILLAVLGSVAATSAVVTAVVCCFQSRRRQRQRQPNMQPPKM